VFGVKKATALFAETPPEGLEETTWLEPENLSHALKITGVYTCIENGR
jgi:hypothetical protein